MSEPRALTGHTGNSRDNGSEAGSERSDFTKNFGAKRRQARFPPNLDRSNSDTPPVEVAVGNTMDALPSFFSHFFKYARFLNLLGSGRLTGLPKERRVF